MKDVFYKAISSQKLEGKNGITRQEEDSKGSKFQSLPCKEKGKERYSCSLSSFFLSCKSISLVWDRHDLNQRFSRIWHEVPENMFSVRWTYLIVPVAMEYIHREKRFSDLWTIHAIHLALNTFYLVMFVLPFSNTEEDLAQNGYNNVKGQSSGRDQKQIYLVIQRIVTQRCSVSYLRKSSSRKSQL